MVQWDKKYIHFKQRTISKSTTRVFFMWPCSKVWIWMWNVHIKPCKEWETTPTVMVTFQFKDNLWLTTSVSMTASQCHRLKFAQPPTPPHPTPLPPSLLLHLLISLICCSKSPLPFIKTCTFMRPINGIVCTKTSQDGRSIRESTPSRNDYWLGMCECR